MPITRHWRTSSAARERRHLRHLAVTLPHSLWRRNRSAPSVQQGRDSADGLLRTSTTEYSSAREGLGECAASVTRAENSSLGWKNANKADVSAYTRGIFAGSSFPQNRICTLWPALLLRLPHFRHNLRPFRLNRISGGHEKRLDLAITQDAESFALLGSVQQLPGLFVQHF